MIDRPMRNADVDWDTFDPVSYHHNMYGTMRTIDEELIHLSQNHLINHLGTENLHSLHGVDVGVGGNLYPAMIQLPWCRQITLEEPGELARGWLERQLGYYNASWDHYWRHVSRQRPHVEIKHPHSTLHEVCRVENAALLHGSSSQLEVYDVGTMFNVVEQFTRDPREVELGLRHFAWKLKEGAPFVIALTVEPDLARDDVDWDPPTLMRVSSDDVRTYLQGHVSDLMTVRISTNVLSTGGRTESLIVLGVR